METNDNASESPGDVLVRCISCGRHFSGPGLAGSRCPTCTGELVEIARSRAEPRPDDPIVEVYRARDWLQAELIRAYLEAEGVLVAFRTSATWGIHTFTVDGLGEVAITALEPDADRARDLIADYLERAESAEPPGEEEGD